MSAKARLSTAGLSAAGAPAIPAGRREPRAATPEATGRFPRAAGLVIGLSASLALWAALIGGAITVVSALRNPEPDAAPTSRALKPNRQAPGPTD